MVLQTPQNYFTVAATASPSPPSVRPSTSSAATFVENGKQYLQSLISGMDPQKVLPVAVLAATLGLGTAVYYFTQPSGDNLAGESDSKANGKRSKSKQAKKRNKKSNRVVFQSPVEQDSGRALTADESGETIVYCMGETAGQNMATLGKEDKVITQEEADWTGTLKDTAAGDDKLAKQIAILDVIQPGENTLILKQCPRGRKTPCIASFPLKLETFLRVHKLKYELDFTGCEPRMYSSPWIRFNTEDIADSQNVLHFLMDQYNLKVERELTPEQRSMSTAYTHLLENHLYWGIALWRWVYDGARSLKDIQLLPPKTQQLIPDVCKTVEQAAWFHGIGKLTPEQVKLSVLKDLHSLSDFLGEKDYFLNTTTPTELDCTAFGMLAQFMWNMHGPFTDALEKEYRNLRNFCWRIRLNYWPDWEECLNNTEFYSDAPYPTADSVEYPY